MLSCCAGANGADADTVVSRLSCVSSLPACTVTYCPYWQALPGHHLYRPADVLFRALADRACRCGRLAWRWRIGSCPSVTSCGSLAAGGLPPLGLSSLLPLCSASPCMLVDEQGKKFRQRVGETQPCVNFNLNFKTLVAVSCSADRQLSGRLILPLNLFCAAGALLATSMSWI
jgi:hypothetical protein